MIFPAVIPTQAHLKIIPTQMQATTMHIFRNLVSGFQNPPSQTKINRLRPQHLPPQTQAQQKQIKKSKTLQSLEILDQVPPKPPNHAIKSDRLRLRKPRLLKLITTNWCAANLIYCDSGEVGVVYIDGEISRPGVYNLPTAGRLTLSRLVAAAGGVSELAIPERCDLIRRLSSDKEACVRISLLAIRNRSEPDLFLKKDDHIIVGTNFWALPLARFRRDLSFPNSVGFQLDRNFGNDVFGAPPSGITTN